MYTALTVGVAVVIAEKEFSQLRGQDGDIRRMVK